MAEIKIEPKQRNILPWIIGLILLVLVICGLAAVASRKAAAAPEHPTATTDALRDNTPPRLRQYALVGPQPELAASSLPA